MNTRKTSIDFYLFGLAILIAFIIRLINLGVTPLNDYEASWAVQALQITQGVHHLVGPQPAYIQLTSLLFNIFGSTNFLARFWSALIGSLIVFIPIMLRSKIGNIPAIILSFVLAIDPGLLAVSRQAGSPVIALISGCLVISFWINKKPGWAGIFLGLGLLGGESFWAGLLSMAVSIGLVRLINKESFIKVIQTVMPDREDKPEPDADLIVMTNGSKRLLSNPIAKMIGFAAGTILLLGTLFFIKPIVISGIAGGLTTFLAGWIKPSGVSPLLLLVALVTYHPLAVIFGIWGGVRSWFEKDVLDQILSIWAGVILLLALLYPARQVDSLVWLLIPLWCLAVREILRHVSLPKKDELNTLWYVVLTFVVFVFMWLNLEELANSMALGVDVTSLLATIGVAFILLLFTSLLVSWGWSSRIVKRGLVWGSGLFLILYTISTISGASGFRSQYTSELWTRGANLPQVNLIVQTINQLSNVTKGVNNDLDVVVIGVESPGLQWALRQFPNSLFTTNLAAGSMPSIVITPKQNEIMLAAPYRGDGFVLSQQPAWSSILPNQYVNWFVYHSAPQTTEPIILWVRDDLFPGGSDLPATNPAP